MTNSVLLVIGSSILLIGIVLLVYMFYDDRFVQRYIIYKKRFFDANGIKISNKYIKDIDKFLNIIINFDIYNQNDITTESKLLELEDLYNRIFIKNVNTIYKFNHVIAIQEGYEKKYIDRIMKQIRSEYKTWQKFNNAKEIY